MSEQDIVAALHAAVAAGESPSGAARSVSVLLGAPRKLCYSLSLGLLAEGDEDT